MIEENIKRSKKEEEKKTQTKRTRTRKENKTEKKGTQPTEEKRTRKPYQRRNTNKIMKQEKNEKSSKENNIFKKPKLKIIPLGGLHEIGKNITVFEYENEIIVVDCGLSFPDDDMLGVDLVIPDITYLEKNVDKIKGLVITHGHEDHIGGVPYLLKKINIPIYATRLAAGLIRNKLEEHKLLRSTKLNEVMQGQTIKLGKNFKVEFIRSSHSIPDSVMLAITTPAGTVLHTGDFRKGFTMSESSVGEVFDKLFLHCTKRIVVATFASNVHRVQQIVNSAIKYNRKIAVCGRSMINMIETARNLGYIECPENIFIDIDMINNYTDEQLVIITTGSQGEPMSALTRNGRVLEINENSAEFTSTVPSGRVLVDGLGVGDVGSIVLRDRQHLSQDGLIVIVLTMDSSTGEVIAGPDVISRGFVYVRESENLMDDVKSVVRHEIKKCEEKGIRDWSTIKTTTRENLRDYIFAKTKRNPMIIPIIMEV